MARCILITSLMLSLLLLAYGREVLQSSKSSSTGSHGTVTASSCSLAMAKATWGRGTSHSRAHSKAIVGAGKSCADAVVSALSSSCSGKNAIAAIQAASSACAAAYAKVYVSTVGYSQTDGRSQACAQSCANAYGFSEASAKAIAEGYANSKNSCSEVSSHLKSETFTKVLTEAFSSAFSKACSESRTGRATAATVAEGWLTVTATSVAKALGNVVSISCTQCSQCRCQGGVKYEAESNTDVYSEVVGGTHALTKAVADAGAIFCKGKGKGESSKNAIATYLKAYADICVKVYGKLYAKAATSGEVSFACSGVFGSYKAVAEALSQVVVKAWANNYDGVCAEVFSYVEGSALVKDAAKVVAEAFTSACSANGKPAAVSSKSIYEYITKYQPYSEALQQAYSSATNNCPCPSPYLCCSTCDFTKTCPGYKK